MAIRVEFPSDRYQLREFLAFYDRVHERRAARWPAFVPFELSVLDRRSPYLAGRTIQPVVARDGEEIVARVLAVLDQRYNRHWNERLGHLAMFEALPGSQAASRMAVDAACGWLVERGARAARSGYGLLDLPFVIDDYESLPPTILRQNPPYYHALLKEAGFETERGWVDYRIEVRPGLIEDWRSSLEAARRSGFELVALRDLRRTARAAAIAAVWNDAFAEHWGHTPTSPEEFLFLIDALKGSGVLESSLIAYRGEEPVGALWLVPEHSAAARLAPGRMLSDAERLNVLAICVRRPARGSGLNLAMAACGYLELARRGARYLSYTLVLDDNWPSRRTAEKLGGRVRASYVTYRRELS
jgi:hypothetical protein